MIKYNELYLKSGFYNKGVAKEFGLLQSVVFQKILYSIEKNESNEKLKGKCFISSENSSKFLFPELTSTKVFNAINSLRDNELIVVQNKDHIATEKFNFIISLTEKGNSIYESFFKKKAENSEATE